MIKKVFSCLFFMSASVVGFAATGGSLPVYQNVADVHKMTDTVPVPDVVDVVKIVIEASSSFNGQAVANLYTPNAVVADDEAPYSWNGLTAGVQWINSVERAVKINRITKFKARIDPVNVYQQNVENVYLIIPVTYTGDLPGHEHFQAKGAFAFVLRHIDDRWLIKTQVWMPEKGLGNK
jgi:ketosteroid isomerase-like protein